jgi:hypothetical protein
VFVAESVSMRYGQRANQYQVPPVGCVRLAGTEKTYQCQRKFISRSRVWFARSQS